MLGMDGTVEAEHFEALRNNLHPSTGERLTARMRESSKTTNPRTGKLEERRAIGLPDVLILCELLFTAHAEVRRIE